jgi:outer membrane biosynthesis protein TonB
VARRARRCSVCVTRCALALLACLAACTTHDGTAPAVNAPSASPAPAAASTPPSAASSDESSADDAAAAEDAVATIRREISPRARRCFQRALQHGGTQQGKLVIQVHVDRNGKVDGSVVVRNTGLSANVVRCVANGARAARFSPPGGSGRTIAIPFNFERAL